MFSKCIDSSSRNLITHLFACPHHNERHCLPLCNDSAKGRREKVERKRQQIFKKNKARSKADGQRKAEQLQKYADGLGVGFKLSVVAGPSGSYKEEDLFAMQDQWLEEWVPGRQWEAWVGDAYAPGLTNSIQMQCWQRGYQSFTHGGGTPSVNQTKA